MIKKFNEDEKIALQNKIVQKEQNINNLVNVAGNELTVFDAVKLRDTLFEKIKSLIPLLF